MSCDLENATKATQCAELLCSDLRALVCSDNLMLSDVALAELDRATALHLRLQRLQANLETMEQGS